NAGGIVRVPRPNLHEPSITVVSHDHAARVFFPTRIGRVARGPPARQHALIRVLSAEWDKSPNPGPGKSPTGASAPDEPPTPACAARRALRSTDDVLYFTWSVYVVCVLNP